MQKCNERWLEKQHVCSFLYVYVCPYLRSQATQMQTFTMVMQEIYSSIGTQNWVVIKSKESRETCKNIRKGVHESMFHFEISQMYFSLSFISQGTWTQSFTTVLQKIYSSIRLQNLDVFTQQEVRKKQKNIRKGTQKSLRDDYETVQKSVHVFLYKPTREEMKIRHNRKFIRLQNREIELSLSQRKLQKMNKIR